MDKLRILNIDILNTTRDALLKEMRHGMVFTPNIDHLLKLQHDREFYDCYRKAEWVVCDSRVLQLLTKFSRTPIIETISGSSLFPAFCDFHRDNPACRIFILGAAPGVALTAMQRINGRIGRNIVIGAHSPSYGFEKKPDDCAEIVKMINESGATVVLVGVGAPKQEKWITEHRHKMPGVELWFALGATISFEAGKIDRAPVWMRRCGLEWMHRIGQEPKRMARRYAADLLVFKHLLYQKLGIYRDPFDRR